MPAPLFIQNSGLGFTATPHAPLPRTEISEDQWTRQVNQDWASANPDAARALSLQTVGANLVGVGLMVAGAVTYAVGQKAVGAVLGLGGAGLVAFGFIRDRTVGYGAATGSGVVVGARPGIGMV